MLVTTARRIRLFYAIIPFNILFILGNSACDAPLTLTNYTLDFLAEHWTEDIDFVICSPFTLSSCGFQLTFLYTIIGTGDNARCVSTFLCGIKLAAAFF